MGFLRPFGNGYEVVISSEKVPNPVAVRYCFRDFQVGTMIGGNELPTIPFRTDNW